MKLINEGFVYKFRSLQVYMYACCFFLNFVLLKEIKQKLLFFLLQSFDLMKYSSQLTCKEWVKSQWRGHIFGGRDIVKNDCESGRSS